MEIIQVVGLGLITTFIILVIKEQQPIFAFLLAVFVGMVIFLSLVSKLSEVIEILQNLAQQAHVNQMFLKTVLKIIGVAYIAEFGAQVTRDAGQESLASKIELAGKVIIMTMAIPIITVMIESILEILPS